MNTTENLRSKSVKSVPSHEKARDWENPLRIAGLAALIAIGSLAAGAMSPGEAFLDQMDYGASFYWFFPNKSGLLLELDYRDYNSDNYGWGGRWAGVSVDLPCDQSGTHPIRGISAGPDFHGRFSIDTYSDEGPFDLTNPGHGGNDFGCQ